MKNLETAMAQSWVIYDAVLSALDKIETLPDGVIEKIASETQHEFESACENLIEK